MSRKPSYRMHNGFRMPLGFPPEGFDSGRRYEPKAGDVFVATYPKCGTTWAQYIVYLLVRRRPIVTGESLADLFPHLEEVGAEFVRRMATPRLIKTHLPFEMTPFAAAARYILVVRNPFDCAVSFFHHTRGFPRHYDFADGDIDTFLDCFIDGEVDFGDYFDHLVPWVEAAERPNVLLLTYENLRARPTEGVRSIAAFLGGEVAAAARDDAFVESVVAESGFDSMRRDQSRWSSARPADAPFVRKGLVGGWRDSFSALQTRRLLDRFDRRTAATPAAGFWPEVIAQARSMV